MRTISEDTRQGSIITETTIKRYEQQLRESEHAKATIEKYTEVLRKLMVYLNNQPLTKERLLGFRDHLREGHMAQSVNGFISAINKYLGMNQMDDLKLKLLKVQRNIFYPRDKELTQEDYKRLIATARRLGKTRLALLIETIGSTGIRVGEVKYITFESAQRGTVDVDLKGKTRIIPLEERLREKLLRYANENEIQSGEIFITRNGSSLSRKQIWWEMKSICEEAGVESSKVFPHNLRHLFARCYYKVTHDIAELADMLGHSSIETTRIYLKTSIDEHRKTLKRLRLVT